MITLKSQSEIETIRRASRIVAEVLRLAEREFVKPGVETACIAGEIESAIRLRGGEPAFKGYKGFPASACISVNEEVVHGIPGRRRVRSGDIVSIDVGVRLDGYYGDAAKTIVVGRAPRGVQRLVNTCREALSRAIAVVRPGVRLVEISRAIQRTAESQGFSVVRKYVGHGIGREMHEDPQIPNYEDEPSTRVVLAEGMVLAIEPMINEGTYEVVVLDDGWTAVTSDRKASAHFEHTVAVTDGGSEILTVCGGPRLAASADVSGVALKVG